MMSDAFDARAELEFELKGSREALNDLQDLSEGLIDIGQAQERAEKRTKEFQKNLSGLGKTFKETGDAARSAKKSLDPDAGASEEWKLLAKNVREAESAYRSVSKTAAAAGEAAPNMNSFLASSGVSRSDIAAYRQGTGAGLVKDEGASAQIQDRIAKTVAARAAAEERSRQAQWKAVQDAKERASTEARITRELKSQSDQARNADRASVYSKPRAGSFMAQGQQSGLKASDTSWAKEFAAQTGKAEASLPRLRYALYDVATTAGIVSAAITGVGVAGVAAFASMESSFTNVERTLDGVGGAGVAQLRSELVGLTREIPLAFSNISEIATLGNQLGIASSDIASFTETTAKFSAVTGLTAEASAQAFGSLGELLNIQARDYEALGSSIALVGRKSVATEAEIVAMTTRLAASATNAGFTAQQVIALSGAFASLRIAPERAQGVMEVYFNRLNTAIAEGGPRLQAFARITKESTQGVEDLARTDPTTLFQKLAVGLGEMDQIAQTGALAELGLQGIRAGEVFGRISANVDVFNSSLQDANQGWVEGTELGSQYGKVVDDLASRWQIFINAVTEAGAAVGGALAPALGLALTVITGLLRGFAEFAASPLGQLFTPIAVGAGVLAAAITGLIAALALGAASMAAVRSAIIDLTAATGGATLGLRGLATSATQMAGALGIGTGALRVFKVALATTGIGLAVVAIGSLAAAFMEAGEGASGLSAELQPVADSLARAIDADTATFAKTGEAITTITSGVGALSDAFVNSSSAVSTYVGLQDQTATSVDTATQKIREQTAALGANADAVFRKQLSEDQGVIDLANDPALRAAAAQAGFTIDQLITEALSSAGGATAYVDELRRKADEAHAAANAAIEQKGLGSAETQDLIAYAQSLQEVSDKLQPVAGDLDKVREGALATGQANEYVGLSADGAATGLETVAGAANEAYDALAGAQRAALATEGSLYSLGSSLGENAGMWDVFTEGGRQSLGSLYSVLDAIAAETPGDAMAIASNFQALYNTLIQGGYATEQQLAGVAARIKELSGGAAVMPAVRSFSSLFSGIQSGAQKAAKSLGGGGGGGGLKKEIKTLIDYANDLQGVFKRAFDLRFGNQQALDQISSGWRKISDAAAAARDAADEYQRTLATLAADKSVKEYWLMVAENYGDELRAANLRAELAEISAKMSDEQKGLTKAQNKASMSLVGNTEAAEENRAEVLGLVGEYQDYLRSLAATGMSQGELQQKAAQLRTEFVNQAVSMGYNRTQVELYAKAFDDMGTIIGKIPRNVTVSFTGDAALQAINEFAAKAKTALSGVSTSIGANFDDSGLKKAARGAVLQGQLIGAQNRYARSFGLDISALVEMSQIAARLNTGNYWSGGYVGDGGKYEPKGTVHGGEFVFNKAATRTIGVNNLAHMQASAQKGKVAGPVGLGAAGITELSAYDRMLLQNIADNIGITIGAQTLQATVNGSNTNASQRRSA